MSMKTNNSLNIGHDFQISPIRSTERLLKGNIFCHGSNTVPKTELLNFLIRFFCNIPKLQPRGTYFPFRLDLKALQRYIDPKTNIPVGPRQRF